MFYSIKYVSKYLFIVLSLFSLALNANGQGYVIKTKTQLSQVSRTYGFLLGQEYSLNRISADFPELISQINQVKGEFSLSYGKAMEAIPKSLKDALSDNYNDYEHKLILQLDSITKSQVISKYLATKFITEVDNRTKGNLPIPILETLLTYEFYLEPEQEIIKKYTYTFKTLNHAKSKGTDWLIRVPKSWSKNEASRPNIIQEFRSNNGNGLESMALLVKELPLSKDYVWSSKDLSNMFTEESIKEFIPKGAKYISYKKITLDNNQAGMLEIEQVLPRLDMEFKIRSIQFFVYRGNKMYMLACAVSSNNKEEDLQSQMTTFLPLFRLVANSIVFNDQYKK